jgi:hypothetical protein
LAPPKTSDQLEKASQIKKAEPSGKLYSDVQSDPQKVTSTNNPDIIEVTPKLSLSTMESKYEPSGSLDRQVQEQKHIPSLKKVGNPNNEINRQKIQVKTSCSCRSKNRCTGPRGGKYCITSGGHKQYGR